MIRAILEKEALEYRRDGRLRGVLGLTLVLAVGALFIAWPTYITQQRASSEAQGRDRATFLRQGAKAPHAAAHFGRLAHKPAPALAVFDPGATPYLGQVVWLEAHRQDPAMFRPAEDSPELRRLADLSVAGVLTLVSPLLLCLAGYGVFARERERGSLKQVLSMGVRAGALFAGKLTALAAIGVAVSTIVICIATAAALVSPSASAVSDTMARAVWLVAAYAAYNVAFAALVVAVSSRARSSAAALVLLLCIWTGAVVLAPRLAATVAEHLYPAPEAGVFWEDAADAARALQSQRRSPAYRSLEREVVRRALGRDVDEAEMGKIEVNRFGLALEISEILGARAYGVAYQALYETYEKQQRVRRLLALIAPGIVLQHASGALAGTDIAAHRHFALAAEAQRQLIIRAMNEDLMLKGAGRGFDYLATAELWGKIPEFAYEPPTAAFALRTAAGDLIILFLWSVAALCVACRCTLRQRAL